MKICSVYDAEFARYGRVHSGIESAALLREMEKIPLPESGTAYEPSIAALEACEAFADYRTSVFGGMPVQLGMCWGRNTKLNCLEYHRDSEFNLGLGDFILLLAKQDEIEDGVLDTAKVKAFRVPAGVLVEVYATTLHYAPCHTDETAGFRVLVALPRGTNTEKPALRGGSPEDKYLAACNKWLLAHSESTEAKNGAAVALRGGSPEDKYLAACNKWLLAHSESAEAKNGAAVALRGENIDIAPELQAPMDIADKIIEALREKYRPLGIAVYGSFADGSNNRNSDFDALLLLPDGETGHDDSVLFGTELDVWLYGAAHFAAPYDAEDFLQLHDSVIVEDATGRLSALRAEVNAHIESAPQKTEAENAQSLSWCRKMLQRTERGDAEGCYRLHWLLTDSLSIYYDLRGEYYFGPKKALRRMAKTAPDDAAVYERALHEPSPENLAAWVGVLEETFSRRYRP